MITSFVILIREGLEAALIIGIILAYLTKTNGRRQFSLVWTGVALGVLVSLVTGAVVYYAAGELEGPAEQIFEGTTMFIAVGVLTWMIFWMRKQAVNIRTHLQAQVDSALTSRSSWALVILAFVAVVREGIETVLFLFAATQTAESPISFASGGILGLLAAAAIGYGIYKGATWFNLKYFFNATGVILILFAAGLVAHGVHEFNEVGFIPSIIEHVWDTNGTIQETSTLGRFLGALFGYNGNPSLTEVIAYLAFLAATLGGYFALMKGKRRTEAT